jgi:hypothetical protein
MKNQLIHQPKLIVLGLASYMYCGKGYVTQHIHNNFVMALSPNHLIQLIRCQAEIQGSIN